MYTAREKANKRLQDRWEKAERIKQAKVEEYEQEKKEVAKTIQTKGWTILVRTLEDSIRSLSEELANTSALRVFKGMELRSERKNLKKLLTSMQGEHKKFLSDTLIKKE